MPVSPARLLDTRSTGKVPAGGTVSVQVTGKAGIPDHGVAAVVLNLTVTGDTKPGYLSAYPGGTTFSGTSVLNFAAHETRANLVTVPVGADGTVTVLNGGGPGTAPAHVIADLQGYYASTASGLRHAASTDAVPHSQFFTTGPDRLYDTRQERGPLAPGETFFLDGGFGSEADATITALALNVTAVGPTRPGYVTAWDGDGAAPNTSVLNFGAGRTTPNNMVVPVSHITLPDGSPGVRMAFRNGSSGTVHLLFDVVGIYAPAAQGGLVFHPLPTPQRIVDSRTGTGLAKLGAGQTGTVSSTGPVIGPATEALVGNLTAVRPTKATYLTVWPGYDGQNRPTVSALNPAAGQTVANHLVTELNVLDQFKIYNNAGTTDVLVDVTGRFDRPSTEAQRHAQPPPRFGAFRVDRSSQTASPRRPR